MVSVRLWREINAFDPLAGGKLNVDDTVKMIAAVRDKSVDEVESMPIADLLPEFLQCVHDVNATVFSKLPKNANGDGQ